VLGPRGSNVDPPNGGATGHHCEARRNADTRSRAVRDVYPLNSGSGQTRWTHGRAHRRGRLSAHLSRDDYLALFEPLLGHRDFLLMDNRAPVNRGHRFASCRLREMDVGLTAACGRSLGNRDLFV